MGLSDRAILNAKPKEKKYVLKDDDGLSLEVWPTGRKVWMFRYWINNVERRKTLGRYPTVSLREARDMRDNARMQLDRKIDPFANSKATACVFDEYALLWWERHKLELKNAKNIQTTEHRVKAFIVPAFKNRDPRGIMPHEIFNFIKNIERTGKRETARRTMDLIRQIFRFMVTEGLLTRNPVTELVGILDKPVVEHHPSITDPGGIAVLRDKIREYKGSHSMRCAMLFSLYTFARPGEVRHYEWPEINFETKEWHIPAEKMKAGVKHIVPLSRQALAVLEEIRPFSECHGKYVFPAPLCYDGSRTYSDSSINRAFVRQMKYGPKQVTAHGFRSTASTVLNESGIWHYDAIEAQLAHSGVDRVRKAYNYAKYLQERREMMQWYADYIDGLKAPDKEKTD